MCTLTWLANKEGYEVFFNRDEQRSRTVAKPPCYDSETDSIMPIDPQGKGTWIAVNSSGVTLCLLNNYQAESNTKTTIHTSRGLLIPILIKHGTHEKISQQLKNIDLHNYMPFWLCVFPENFKRDNESMDIYQWDGDRLTKETQKQPVVSSAISLPEVQQKRSSLFDKMIAHKTNSGQHLSYHSSHNPKKGKYSVCMHRNDARTQSLSHIMVGDKIVFRYHDSPPCMNVQWSQLVISSSERYDGRNN